MRCSPPAKINIGLYVKARRPDGFHEIETLFCPVALCDLLEVTAAATFTIRLSGLPVDAPPDANLCVKAYRLLQTDFDLPPVAIDLHKAIPPGAGLGGGSSDATAMLRLLNALFSLRLSDAQLRQYAVRIGSDCAFFLHNRPMLATGRGEILRECALPHRRRYFIVLLKPRTSIPTAAAYAAITPRRSPPPPLDELLQQPLDTWKDRVVNDFEPTVFAQHPSLRSLKQRLYKAGALYASMSGSGSALFGLFPAAAAAAAAAKTLPGVLLCAPLRLSREPAHTH
jgi:4-diphosphocytidyl-2-C-methyl-D-erythritol kinase